MKRGSRARTVEDGIITTGRGCRGRQEAIPAGADVRRCGLQPTGRRGRNGGGEAGLVVVSGRGLPPLLCRLADPPCVLGRNERELAVVGDDVCEIGGDTDGLLLGTFTLAAGGGRLCLW